MAPRRWGPLPGKQVNSGSASRAKFTLPDEPRIRKFLISVTKSLGRSVSSTIFKKESFGSKAEITLSALYSSPFLRATPIARPLLTITFSTDASVIILAPKYSADRAIAMLTAPVPPRWNPHARNAPSISPI